MGKKKRNLKSKSDGFLSLHFSYVLKYFFILGSRAGELRIIVKLSKLHLKPGKFLMLPSEQFLYQELVQVLVLDFNTYFRAYCWNSDWFGRDILKF